MLWDEAGVGGEQQPDSDGFADQIKEDRLCPRAVGTHWSIEGCGEDVNVTWSNLLFRKITLIPDGGPA